MELLIALNCLIVVSEKLECTLYRNESEVQDNEDFIHDNHAKEAMFLG